MSFTEDSPVIGKSWIAPDGHGCYHFWYHRPVLWLAPGNDRIQNTLPRVSGMKLVDSVGSLPRKQTGSAKTRGRIRKGRQNKADLEASTSGLGSTA